MAAEEHQFVSRGGAKLAAALDAFEVSPAGWICADFGSHVGGFVDCLLQRGAARVYAVDPGYGVLDYRLRKDPRVVVCERTNALTYATPEPCDLVTIDVGWTQQRLVLPAARRCLKPAGRVITLIKPQYEAPHAQLRHGVLPAEFWPAVRAQLVIDVTELGWTLAGEADSPLTGHGGNREYLWLLANAR
jgi:23S rRNA (cytidine1920-2'-O)/16S rRNA (cytidine1409-2'-O)-methyltransferase